MQTPTRDSEPSDFQQLYRKHVHENMLLHERLKNLSAVEKSKIRSLKNDAAMFKGKYMKYMKQKSVQDSDIVRSDTQQCKHKSAYLISKDYAYSAKTWHDLVDVSKPSLDLYKTEVLKNTVGETPETKPPPIKVIHRNSTGLLYKYNTPGGSMPVPTKSAQIQVDSNALLLGNNRDKQELDISQKVPTILVSDGEHISNTVSLGQGPAIQGHVNIAKCKSENNLPFVTQKNRAPERQAAGYSLNLSPRDLSRSSSPTLETDRSYTELSHYRERSHTVGTTSRPNSRLARRRNTTQEHEHNSLDLPQRCHNVVRTVSPSLQMERKRNSMFEHDDSSLDLPEYRERSKTIGSTSRRGSLSERRHSCGRRHSCVSLTNDVGINWQLLKRKTKVACISLSLLHDAREIEVAKTAKSFEDLRHCRYLRSSDDKSFKEGLDDRTYSREHLNSSCEDISAENK